MDTAVGSSVLIQAFRLALTVEGLRPHTVQNYVGSVSQLAAHMRDRALDAATPDDIREFTAAVHERCAPKTVHEAQLGLRRFYRFLIEEGEVASDPTQGMKLARYRVDPQPTYTEAEVKRLLLVCNTKSSGGLRDRALVTVLFDTGVRVGELVSMGLPDWQRRVVRVEGKTGIRDVFLGTAALQTVERYARRWRITEGRLWRGKKGPLTESGVHQAVARLCARAAVPDKGVHAFRRAAAAQMKRLGMQDSDILEVMGWKDVTMLRRYTAAVAGELAQSAHQRFSPGDALQAR